MSMFRKIKFLTLIVGMSIIGSAFALSGCVTTSVVARDTVAGDSVTRKQVNVYVPAGTRALYASIDDGRYNVPAINIGTINKKYWRQLVVYPTSYQPGTIIIDTQKRFLYLIQPGGQALRYGVGVGKEGLAFTGEAVIGSKRDWPHWSPTKDMMLRNPERYGHMSAGIQPGPDNPLGARALYLFKNGADTHFRIHGSHEAWSIGHAMSSGCIRMLNQDVMDLYDRVKVGARVIVLSHSNESTMMPEMPEMPEKRVGTVETSILGDVSSPIIKDTATLSEE